MNRVWASSRQKGNNRLMLLAIADHANDDGLAWPGIQTLAAKMGGLSRRAAGKRVRALASSRELAVFPRPGSSHDYIVLVGMDRAQVRAAFRRLSTRRKAPISALIDLRRKFAGWAADGASQVGAPAAAHGTRTSVRTNRQEPSFEPSGAAAAALSVFAAWEAEARSPLTPMLGQEIGDLVDVFGESTVVEAIREAVRATGPGQFGVKYVRRICERWGREGKTARRPADSHPPRLTPEPDESKPITAHREVLERVAAQVRAGRTGPVKAPGSGASEA